MTKSVTITQPVSSIMSESTKAATSSMFATSPKTHLYGGPSIPLEYHSFSRTISEVSSSPWNYQLSSPYGIIYGSSLPSTPQLVQPNVSQNPLDQQYDLFLSGLGHPKPSIPSYRVYPPTRGE